MNSCRNRKYHKLKVSKFTYFKKNIKHFFIQVIEETGFDARPYVDPFEYLEKNFNDQLNRLYLICNIPLDTLFQPKTRREIRVSFFLVFY